MIQDVLAVEGFLMEHLPSHLVSLPDGISGDPAVWTGASKWGLFREGHVAPWRNDNPGRARSEAGIGWLQPQEHGRGQEVWQKGIWGLSCPWRHRLPGQELTLGA